MPPYHPLTPAEFADRASSQKRTNRWVKRHVPARTDFFSPSLPPAPVDVDRYQPNELSDTDSTDSLPPPMVLKYTDGRPSIPISHYPPPKPSREHYHGAEQQHRRHRSLSEHAQRDEPVHTSYPRHHEQRAPVPPVPEKIRVLPSRSDHGRPSSATTTTTQMRNRPASDQPQRTQQQYARAPSPMYGPTTTPAHTIPRPHTSHAATRQGAYAPPHHPHPHHPVRSESYAGPRTAPAHNPYAPPAVVYSHSAPVPSAHAARSYANGYAYPHGARPAHASHADRMRGLGHRGVLVEDTEDEDEADGGGYRVAPAAAAGKAARDVHVIVGAVGSLLVFLLGIS
jgi:hypothetical protein